MTEPSALPAALPREKGASGLADIGTIGVVGAGQMGIGIAEVCSRAGYGVTLSDLSRERAEASKAALARRLDGRVALGKLDEVTAERVLGGIVPVELDGQAGADLLIEAATEDVALKLALFERLEGLARRGAILTSNTSSISLTRIAAATKRPELVCGMHFMNPVPVMELCEIVRGLQTSAVTLRLVTSLAQKLGKTTVVSEDRPGFLVNRVLIPLLNEACFALEEGVSSAEDLDTAVRLGLGHPMGPLALADLIGLDTVLAIAEVLHRDFGDSKYRPAPLLRNLVTAGWLGQKTKRGFYSYDAAGSRGPSTTSSRGVAHEAAGQREGTGA